MWVERDEEELIHEKLGQRKHQIVAYKPKRGKYLGYQGADFSEESLKSFLDNILGGGGDWSTYNDELFFRYRHRDQSEL